MEMRRTSTEASSGTDGPRGQGEHVDRTVDLGHDPGDVLQAGQPGRVDDVRAGGGVGLEAGDGVVEVGMAVEVVLGPSRQHEAARPGRGDGRRHPLGGHVDREDGLGRRVVVLQRAAGRAGLADQLDGAGDPAGVVGEAALGVDVERDLDGGGHRLGVGQELVAGHVLVEPAEGGGVARAGRGQRREPERGEDAGGSDVPRVGHHERAGLVEGAELGGAVSRHGALDPTRPRTTRAPALRPGRHPCPRRGQEADGAATAGSTLRPRIAPRAAPSRSAASGP